MTTVYVTTHRRQLESVYTPELDADSNEMDGPYDGFRSSQHEFKVTGAQLDEPERTPYTPADLIDSWDFQIPGFGEPEEIYVVWVQYSDGDTFGHSTGLGQVLGAFHTLREAEAMQAAIMMDGSPIQGPWHDYFAKLEGVFCKKVSVTPHDHRDIEGPSQDPEYYHEWKWSEAARTLAIEAAKYVDDGVDEGGI